MPYPKSPFPEGFNAQILYKTGADCSEGKEISNLDSWLRWLCEAPGISSYRVNTFINSVDDVLRDIQDELFKISKARGLEAPNSYIHPNLPELIVVENYDINKLDFSRKQHEVVVDVYCGAAVLRGSHIFAPGVIGMTAGTKIDDTVSIYADVAKKCKKGYQKVYEEKSKVFLGNGTVKLQRHQLFRENVNISGTAVELIYPTSGCPPLGEGFILSDGAILQNIPSVICTHVLNPLPGNVVLDMCASPGNKTTHIAQYMQDGIIVAIDRKPNKLKWLQEKSSKHQNNVYLYQTDSTKICDLTIGIKDEESTEIRKNIADGPPYARETFDKVLLDAPCSALGKRPQLCNFNSERVIKSFIPLQRKLFTNAVHLLKVGGIMVYSTCTITLAENEGIVAWALRKFDCIQLQKAEPHLGGQGWMTDGLSIDQLGCLQRFGPSDDIDSVGFFIAKFVKTKPCLQKLYK